MVRILASLAVAATMLAGASSEASAWVCRATGLGSGGWARSVNRGRCQDLGVAAVRAQQPDSGLHDPVVSARRLSMIPKSCRLFG